MGADSVERFSSRVDDYAKYRPSYPRGVVEELARECDLKPHSVVADVGSGTGLLSKLFVDFGCEVLGVEPNAGMRAAADRYLAGEQRFRGVDGHAENTGLLPASVDLVAAGQAFHWFDAARARVEFRRILRAPAWTALVWNEREVSGDPFLEGYEALLKRYAGEYEKVDHRRIDAAALASFFGDDRWRTVKFRNEQRFDFAGVRGRALSSSYVPRAGAPGHDELMRELQRLFEATQRDGRVSFVYTTRLHYGALA